jgi:hypothetical protein
MIDERSQRIDEILAQMYQLELRVINYRNEIDTIEADLTKLKDSVEPLTNNILSIKTSTLLALEEIEELNIAVTLLLKKSTHDVRQ